MKTESRSSIDRFQTRVKITISFCEYNSDCHLLHDSNGIAPSNEKVENMSLANFFKSMDRTTTESDPRIESVSVSSSAVCAQYAAIQEEIVEPWDNSDAGWSFRHDFNLLRNGSSTILTTDMSKIMIKDETTTTSATTATSTTTETDDETIVASSSPRLQRRRLSNTTVAPMYTGDSGLHSNTDSISSSSSSTAMIKTRIQSQAVEKEIERTRHHLMSLLRKIDRGYLIFERNGKTGTKSLHKKLRLLSNEVTQCRRKVEEYKSNQDDK